MRAVDFEYDGRMLSDIGFEICHFDGNGGFETSSAGSELSLTTISTHGGKKHSMVSATYEDVFTGTISIVNENGATVSTSQYSYIMRWLNKKTFAPLKIISSDIEDITFMCTFSNIEKVEHLGRIIGFNLNFTTNAPFGWGDQETDSFSAGPSSSHIIENTSEEDGDLPFDEIVISCNESGILELTNEANGVTTRIAECQAGEVITIKGWLLTVTSSNGRNVYDSFNFKYPELVGGLSSDSETVNTFTSSLSCDITAKYTPIRKVVF